ncbi:MAG: LysR family transcriptional regulator [Betaproteobacteria bacterium]|nr:LysR family transcriptional regulator [Betaproteobacteria bacterium]
MLVIGMELRDLEYFTVVAKHGHLGRAAEALDLTQPALSKSLRRLEYEFGAKLVKRTPKGVELTAEGSVLLGRAGDLQLSIQAVAQEVRDVGRGRIGHVRIGAGPVSSAEMLVEALAPLITDTSKVTYDIVISDNDLMIPALRRGELDLIVGYAPRALPRYGLVEDPLFNLQFAVVAAASHPLASRKVVTLADLVSERWTLTASSLLTQKRLHRIFLENGLAPPVVAVETRSLRLRLQLVALTNLLEYTSLGTFQSESRRFRLKALPVKELAWCRMVSVIYREGAYLSPAARRLIESIKTTAASWKQ